jgi:citrate lyase alpha subunit
MQNWTSDPRRHSDYTGKQVLFLPDPVQLLDVIVTELSISINSLRKDLVEKIIHSRLPIKTIEVL